MSDRSQANQMPVGATEEAVVPARERLYKNTAGIESIPDPMIRFAIYQCTDPDLMARLATGFPECFSANPADWTALPREVFLNLAREHPEGEYPLHLFWSWEESELPFVGSYWADERGSTIQPDEVRDIAGQLNGKRVEPLIEVSFRGMKCIIVTVTARDWNPAEGSTIPDNLDIGMLHLAPASCILD